MANLIDILLRMRGTRAVVAQAGQAAAAIQSIGTAATTATATSGAAQKKMARSSSAIYGRIGRQAKLLSLGIGVVAGVSYKAAADFDQALNIFNAVAVDATAHMAEARAEAIKLGSDIRLPGVSAKDAADTMLLLAKAGFSATESITSARGALLLSQAAGMDAAESTTILARTLRAFEMPAADAAKVVDALAAGELKTTVTMREIADGMTYVAASAHQMGIGLVDTTTALAILNDAGVAGTKAGTSLNQMFVRMSTPTKKATVALKALHLWTKRGSSAFFDEQGQFVGMRKATELLSSSMLGLTREQRLHNLYAIFGREGIRAANLVLARGVSSYDEYRKAIGKSGEAQRLVNARLKGSKAAIEALRNAWDTFKIQFGGALAPMITPVVKALAKFFGLLARHRTTAAVTATGIFALATSIWALSVAAKVARDLKILTGAETVLAAISMIAGGAVAFLDAALGILLLPITLVLLALVALGVGFYLLYTRVAWFRTGVNWLWQELKAFWGWVKAYWPLLLFMLTGPFGLAVAFIVRHWQGVKAVLGAVFGWIKDNWKTVISAMFWPLIAQAKIVIAIFNRMKSAVTAAIDAVVKHSGPLVSIVKKLDGVRGHLGFIGSALGKAGDVGRFAGVLPKKRWAGGMVTRPEVSLVGDHGPELLRLPVGSRVMPLEGGLSGGNSFTEAVIPVQVILDRRVVGESVARFNADKRARK